MSTTQSGRAGYALPPTLDALTRFVRPLTFGRPLRFARYSDGRIGPLRRRARTAIADAVEVCDRLINRRAIRWVRGVGMYDLGGKCVCLVGEAAVRAYSEGVA